MKSLITIINKYTTNLNNKGNIVSLGIIRPQLKFINILSQFVHVDQKFDEGQVDVIMLNLLLRSIDVIMLNNPEILHKDNISILIEDLTHIYAISPVELSQESVLSIIQSVEPSNMIYAFIKIVRGLEYDVNKLIKSYNIYGPK